MRPINQTKVDSEGGLSNPGSTAGGPEIDLTIDEFDLLTGKADSALYIEAFGHRTIRISVYVHQTEGSHVNDLTQNIEERSFAGVLGVVEGNDLVSAYLTVSTADLR